MERIDKWGLEIIMAEDINFKRASLTSYDHDPSKKCWYDECNCEDIAVADCDALVEENNKGLGRFACLVENQDCYNPKFFTALLKKLTCQIDHILQNICGLWDIIQCIIEYLKNLGDMGTVTSIYLRNSAVSSATFYRPITDSYTLSIYMDSITGVEEGVNDDKRRKLTDRKYRAYIRWCADGTTLDPQSDNTMMFTVYHSGENFTDDIERQCSVHWQMTGISDGAMEMSDSIILPKGTYIKIKVTPENVSSGVFRLHQFKVEYTPVLDNVELPECLK